MLVVTGTQRSGTSIMSKFLIEAGYTFDKNVDWDEAIKGGYDNVNIDRFFREYLGDARFSYADIDDMAKEAVSPSLYPKGEACKIAYLLQNPIFIYIWHKYRGNQDKFIVMDRNKEFVYKTKQRRWDRFQHDSLLLQQSAEELDIMFKKSLRVMDELKMKYVVCPMPYVFLKWETFSNYVGQLTFIAGKEPVFNRVIDTSKIHYLNEMIKKGEK